jgi:hypothetical protein
MIQYGNSPDSWRWNASVLLDGAALLYRAATVAPDPASLIPSFPPEMVVTMDATPEQVAALRQADLILTCGLLLAYAVECAIKARIPDKVGGDGKLTSTVRSHNLPRLAAIAKIALTESEHGLLDDLRKFSVWIGRYPIPEKPEDLGWELSEKRGLGQMLTEGFALCQRLNGLTLPVPRQ